MSVTEAALMLLLPLGAGIAAPWLVSRLRRGRAGAGVSARCEPLCFTVPAELDQSIPFEGAARSYRTNPYRLTCSCLEFQLRRRWVPKGRVERLCPHLAQTLLEHGVGVNTPLEPLFLDGDRQRCYVADGDEALIGYSPGRDWLQIYAKSERTEEGGWRYARFAYHVVRRQWGARGAPVNEARVLRVIQMSFPPPRRAEGEPSHTGGPDTLHGGGGGS